VLEPLVEALEPQAASTGSARPPAATPERTVRRLGKLLTMQRPYETAGLSTLHRTHEFPVIRARAAGTTPD
jgi:hypothetical protein